MRHDTMHDTHLQDGTEVSRIEGADPAALTTAIATQLAANAGPAAKDTKQLTASASSVDVTGRIKFMLSQHPVLLAMKGTPKVPRCGFSSRVVSILNDLEVCSPIKVSCIKDNGHFSDVPVMMCAKDERKLLVSTGVLARSSVFWGRCGHIQRIVAVTTTTP
jgi:hypothetical protein